MDPLHHDFASHDSLLDYAGFPPDHDPSSASHSYPPFLVAHLPPSANPSWPPLSMDDAMPDPHAHHRHPPTRDHPPPGSSAQYAAAGSSQQQQPQPQQQQQPQHHLQPQHQQNVKPTLQSLSRPSSSSNHEIQPCPLQTTGLDMTYANMLPNHWQYELHQTAPPHQQHQPHFSMPAEANPINMTAYNPSFGAQLQTSPVDFMPTTTGDNYAVTAAMASNDFMTMAGPMESMSALVYPLPDYQNDLHFPMSLTTAALTQRNAESAHSSYSSIPGGSPTGSALEVNSLSENEGTGAWNIVNYNSRHSFESTISNPSQNLHIRTNSDCSSSDDPSSAELSGSYEEIHNWPLASSHDLNNADYIDSHYMHQHVHGMPIPSSSTMVVSPSAGGSASYSSSSSSTSPSSSGPTSPPLRRRKSPVEANNAKTTKAVIKKSSPAGGSSRKDAAADKKVGRRRGPLRPEQRQQAHEIRKLRACLRCKFLKKTCDKGEPCGGCRPSHARLWQVPCTRMDIKDIGYFMKDWKVDYERHVSLGFSVGNIKGFSTLERTLYITHGYGFYIPINAREVFVRDDKCFEMDWTETENGLNPENIEVNTAKLSAGMEGVNPSLLSEYLDQHLEQGFLQFVDAFFEGTKFLTEILHTAYRFYLKEKTPAIRKALKLVLAYNLTQHITMVEGLSEEEEFRGKIDDHRSRWYGKTVAPVMINFQIKCALADLWRDLQKDILEELSSLYSSVYSGEKLKNWPTIFMLAAILLAIWEEMQFDCHYRTPDEAAVNKFCDDMETTPVGVIVGLFQAISTKLPALQEWDTRKHHHMLGSNPAICDALTEVKGHVNKYEQYLKDRSKEAKFDRQDYDCLSNKFLSRLVIRAN